VAGLRKIVGPFGEPVTLAQAKTHAHVDSDDENDAINGFITSAREVVEAFVRQCLVRTIYEYTIDGGFPSEIVLPIGPVLDASTIAIEYVDDQGDSQTLATSVYRVSTGETCRIRPEWGQVWPHTRPVSDAVTVSFTAGYAAGDDGSPTDYAANVPRIFKDAVLALVTDQFENRGPDGGDLSEAWQRRLRPYQRHA
jgi:uncharacterized phiE125 gp8 family phage protein